MKDTSTFKNLSFLLLTLFFTTTLRAQIEYGGLPPSLSKDLYGQFISEMTTKVVPSLDLEKVKKEDRALPGTVRFAAPVDVNLNLYADGEGTEMANGDVVWRMKVTAANALGVFFIYENFHLPQGGKLFMYDEVGQQLKGAYTARNHTKSGRFMTGMIKGQTAIIEYHEPAASRGQANIRINRVMQAYHADNLLSSEYEFNAYSAADLGDALPCHVNVNCPEGSSLQTVKRGVTRIARVFDEGIGWCSGSLVNNTSEDATPYVLSAYHCVAGYTPQYDLWRFDFNYESENCISPTEEPSYQSMLGCSFVAGRQESDFSLLLLDQNVPSSYEPYFNGWNRDMAHIPTSAAFVHHPKGDLKKIGIEYNQTSIFNSPIVWNNDVTTPGSHHIRAVLDVGTIEPGSSGSPLFDQNGHIVGQLHGGNTSCDQFITYSGRIAFSWESGTEASSRLKDWLDPAFSGANSIGGYDPPNTGVSINGLVDNESGMEVKDVEIVVNNTFSYLTGEQGNYFFDALNSGENYTITPSKNLMPLNGVTTFDLVLIQQHILNVSIFETTEKLIAADANNNGTITTFDLIILKQLILNIIQELPASDSWRFDPPSVEFDNLTQSQDDINFRAIKIGDVNGTADPNL